MGTYGLGVTEVTESTAGDGVESQLVWLPVLVDAVGDHTDRLPLSVGNLSCGRAHDQITPDF